MNEINYKSFFEQLPILKLVLDTDLRILTASDLFLDITKTTLENIVGKNILVIYPPQNQKTIELNKIEASLKRVLQNKKQDKITVSKYELIKPNDARNVIGKKYWRLLHSPIFDEAHNLKYIVQVTEEISEDEFSEDKLTADDKHLVQIEATNDRYYKMLMNSPFAFCILKGNDLIIGLANDLMKTFWGKGTNVEGKSLLEILPEVVDQPFPDLIRNVLKSGKPFYMNEILARIKYNGIIQDKYFNIVYQPYCETNQTISGVTTIGYEVTEMVMARKKTQKNELISSFILESSPDCIKIIDKNGRIEFMNDNGLCLLEMDNITEAKNKYWWELWDEQDKPMIQNAVSKALAKEKVHFQASGNTVKGNGKWWDVIILPMQLNEGTGKIEKLLTVSRDITDYKKANLKIVESEHKYKQIIYSSPFLIAILKGNNFIVEIANDSIIEAWGKGKDIIGKSLLDIIPEIVEQGFKEILNNVFATGKTFEATEMPVSLHRNGVLDVIYFTFVYQAQKNVSGEIESISIIAREVTPQVIINKKIKASEEQFRLLVQQAPVAICVLIGKNYVIETINDPMVQMWNRTMKEVINKPAFDVLTELKDQNFKELLDNVYDTGIPFVAEELPIILFRNGTLENAFVKFVYEPLRDADGSIKGIMALAIEITEQVLARKKIEESEKHFRHLADMMPSKISNADTDGNLLYLNKKWLDYTGKSFEEISGLGYHKIMHPDELEEFTQKFLYANDTKTVLKMEMRFLNKFGEYKWHLNIASPIIDQDGNITMWIGSTTEIHDQITQKELLISAVKERTIELEIANKELVYQNSEKEKRSAELGIANEQLAIQNEEKEKRSVELISLNKELHSFTYIASHDLQDPLRKIQLFTGRITDLEHDNLSEEGKDYFKRIKKAVDRMQQLIEDLLTFSRTSTADRKLISTNLKTIIDEVKEELKETIEEKKVLIEIGKMCHADIIVFQFRQLMHNLISNSIKFSVPGVQPHIIIDSHLIKGSEVQNEYVVSQKMYCHISVKDNGIGFEPEHSIRIFEVFQRLHGKETYKGTGIGLAIVNKIVENHNGIINATSNLGEGATFNIYLPVLK